MVEPNCSPHGKGVKERMEDTRVLQSLLRAHSDLKTFARPLLLNFPPPSNRNKPNMKTLVHGPLHNTYPNYNIIEHPDGIPKKRVVVYPLLWNT